MTTTQVLERAELKAATTDTGTRTLDFYAAAFSATPDSNNDLIDPKAADAWLQQFYAAGKALPISFAHSAMWDMTDPGRFIGYAPADPDHVWIDDYGVRVKAILNTDADGPMGENARAAARLVDQQVVSGASITYIADKAVAEKSGVRRITKLQILEAGPCLVPANPDAVILGIKTADGRVIAVTKDASTESVDAALKLILEGEDVEQLEVKADTSPWDANRAMGECDSAADYRSICAAEHTVGTPDERQHWAGPHHFLGKDANEAGVRAALARWGTTYADTQLQNCTEEQWSKGLSHLQGHMGDINPDYEPATKTLNELAAIGQAALDEPFVPFSADIGEQKHAFSPRHIQGAHDALVRAGAKCMLSEDAKTAPPTDEDEVDETLRRLRFMKTSLV